MKIATTHAHYSIDIDASRAQGVSAMADKVMFVWSYQSSRKQSMLLHRSTNNEKLQKTFKQVKVAITHTQSFILQIFKH